MNKGDSTKKETKLRKRLNEEAMAARPEFSQTLHDRFCDAIRESVSTENNARPDTKPTIRHYRLIPAAITAAACLAIAAGIYWWGHSPSPQAISTPSAPNPLAALADVPARAALSAEATASGMLASNQWGGLNEDAKTAAKMLLDSLPLNMLAKTADSHPAN